MNSSEKGNNNEIRVSQQGQVSAYLGYAIKVLNKSESASLTVKAEGNAIVKALILVELVKRRVGDLAQLNSISSKLVEVETGNFDEGEENVIMKRVTSFTCQLSKSDDLDTAQAGYQEPIAKEDDASLNDADEEYDADSDTVTEVEDSPQKVQSQAAAPVEITGDTWGNTPTNTSEPKAAEADDQQEDSWGNTPSNR